MTKSDPGVVLTQGKQDRMNSSDAQAHEYLSNATDQANGEDGEATRQPGALADPEAERLVVTIAMDNAALAYEVQDYISRLTAENERRGEALHERIHQLSRALRLLLSYSRWTVSDESPGHHPTFPSAIALAAERLREHGDASGKEPDSEVGKESSARNEAKPSDPNLNLPKLEEALRESDEAVQGLVVIHRRLMTEIAEHQRTKGEGPWPMWSEKQAWADAGAIIAACIELERAKAALLALSTGRGFSDANAKVTDNASQAGGLASADGGVSE